MDDFHLLLQSASQASDRSFDPRIGGLLEDPAWRIYFFPEYLMALVRNVHVGPLASGVCLPESLIIILKFPHGYLLRVLVGEP